MRSQPFDGFRAVLCPLDFSAQSRLALRYAAAIARRERAALTVAYVTDPLLVAAASAALHDRHLVKRSTTELRAFVDASFRSRSRPSVKFRVTTGEPAAEILAGATATRSDLIVLGTHGLTGPRRLLIGSTTLGVLQRTTVPVLAVPKPTRHRLDGSPPRSWPGRQIVAPLDLGAEAGEDVERGARVARWFGTSLLLLHVVERIAAPGWLKGDLDAQERMLIATAQTTLDRLARSARRHVRTDARVVCGRPADAIAAVASAEGTSLLLTALRERRGWWGPRRGAVSYHVLSYAVSPVLAYPPGWRAR